MSKHIDADLLVEMQIYDHEHEEWGIWNGTIEDLLNQWTEQGCPTPIEVSIAGTQEHLQSKAHGMKKKGRGWKKRMDFARNVENKTNITMVITTVLTAV